MKTNFYFFVILLSINFCKAQIGFGTNSPNAIVEIKANNQISPNNTDGILIPRIDDFPITNPSSLQDGMMVFITGNGATPKGFYFWNNDTLYWVLIAGQHYVGELFGGGIVFYVYDNGQHGLIASLDDLDGVNGVQWGFVGVDIPGSDDFWDGEANTTDIIAAGGAPGNAAGLCKAYNGGGFSDWYLPSFKEINIVLDQDIMINEILNNDGNPSTNGLRTIFIVSSDIFIIRYWTSTEVRSDFILGNGPKDVPNRVRAVRKF